MKREYIQEKKTSYRVFIPYGNPRKYYSKQFSFDKYGGKQYALQQAIKHRDEMKLKLAAGFIDQQKTLNDVIDLWRDIQTFSKETMKKKNGLVKNHILSVLSGNMKFSNIDSIDVQRSLNSAKMKSTAVIKRLKGVWGELFKVAIRAKIVDRDYSLEAEMPRSQKIIKKREQNFDFRLFGELLNDLDINEDGHLICQALLLMSYTGLSPAECYAIPSENVDLVNRTILIAQSLGSSETESNVIKPTKNEGRYRVVYYPEEFQETMEDLCKRKYLFWCGDKLLNSNKVGTFIRNHSDIEFHAYMLRHLFVTNMLQNGASVRVVQDLCGHASGSMTLSYARSNETERMTELEELWDKRDVPVIH